VINSLPTFRREQCSVFSPLTRRNESAETVREHMQMILDGIVLLVPPEKGYTGM
jgi:hypothetical protein